MSGVTYVVATLLHPPLETAETILATENRLVGSHALSILSLLLILLALPTVYATTLKRFGRPAWVGYLVTFVGVALFAISSQFGFIAPVLARDAPVALDTIIRYSPVVAFNAVAAISFMGGFVLLGIVVAKSASKWGGVAMAVGAPSNLLGFGFSQLGSTAFWPVAILGAVLLGLGLGLTGRAMAAAQLERRVAGGPSSVGERSS